MTDSTNRHIRPASCKQKFATGVRKCDTFNHIPAQQPVQGAECLTGAVEPDRGRAARLRTAVRRFHEAGAATGDHREAGVGKLARDGLRDLVVRVIALHARAAEHADGRANAVQLIGRDPVSGMYRGATDVRRPSNSILGM